MIIKDKIKVIFMKVEKLKNVLKILYCYLYDFWMYKHAVFSSKFKEKLLVRDMMLIGHSLEKGMFFKDKKEGWGKEKAFILCKLISSYNERNYVKDEEYVSAVNILDAYKNDFFASKDSQLHSILNRILSENKSLLKIGRAGVKQIVKPEAFDKDEIMRFFKTRSSVRDYSDAPITQEEIDAVIEFANLTPSACNRQSSRVYAIQNKQQIKDFLALQLGDQGWCENAKTLFLITGNMSCFGGAYERHQVYIDGGMYAMNFVMGLHLAGIASCFKMFVREPKLQERVQTLCNIPHNEVPIVCIMAGHYKNEPVNDPISFRINKRVQFVN